MNSHSDNGFQQSGLRPAAESGPWPEKIKKRKKLFWVLVVIGGVVVLTGGVVAYAVHWFGPANDLGLTLLDLVLGEWPDPEALREKMKAVADAYLAGRKAELTAFCEGPYELTVDYSLVPKIYSLGYQSSFYYTHWNVYLPYSLESQSGNRFTVVVNLTDAIPYGHDLDKLRVRRAVVIDDKGQVVKTLEK